MWLIHNRRVLTGSNESKGVHITHLWATVRALDTLLISDASQSQTG